MVFLSIPDMKAGQYPMAYIVRKAGSNLSESEIMGFVAKQVFPTMQIMFFLSSNRSSLDLTGVLFGLHRYHHTRGFVKSPSWLQSPKIPLARFYEENL